MARHVSVLVTAAVGGAHPLLLQPPPLQHVLPLDGLASQIICDDFRIVTLQHGASAAILVGVQHAQSFNVVGRTPLQQEFTTGDGAQHPTPTHVMVLRILDNEEIEDKRGWRRLRYYLGV